jgi:heptose-I-phosphate ethanolaminephosphotransferase
LNFNSRLTAAYVFVGLTNYKEASDFLPTYWRSISIALLIFIVFYGVGLAGLYKRKLYRNNGIFLLVLAPCCWGMGRIFIKPSK